ncbi:glycoside hydrolase family 16 protein [Micromonospora sp. LAH09]|uniref:glycoside hydrolase family 16 protein n=1 Tax=Micromonospora cabrerizensis TaxID=2911213 RepID=UPI001EE83808|nr:glycoside hydrolase family 16 protein [Micromonospora cabrerizensis]MCG5469377.1 glycoside hydrolase family 16 protein [Micromonospora cabrerizensis]
MNSLKGAGVIGVLGLIAVAVKFAADVPYLVFIVTAILMVAAVFVYLASRKRNRQDLESAELSGITRMLGLDGISEARRGRGTRRRGGSVFVPALLVVLLVAGVGLTGWNLVRPEFEGADPDSASVNGPLPGQRSTKDKKLPRHPDDTFFDNFHYRAHNDPALAANGWQVRTEGGGPGIADSWTADTLSFPVDKSAKGGKALQLQASTDGTKAGTRQTELFTTESGFFRGTVTARVFFTDKPVTGRDGDHLNQAFCTISPLHTSADYSELDFEYQPNGGWGTVGSKIDMVSWRSSTPGDRATDDYKGSLAGWRTLMITVTDQQVTYSVDGRALFISIGKTVPREPMRLMFNTWFIDLPFKGGRTYNMRVNWVYAKANKVMSVAQVQKEVDQFYTKGDHHINTLTPS